MLLKEFCDQSWSFWLQKLAENSAHFSRTGVLLVCVHVSMASFWFKELFFSLRLYYVSMLVKLLLEQDAD